jgi:hypothetical protein
MHCERGKYTVHEVRFVAFPATECDEVFSGYQPGQNVVWGVNTEAQDRDVGSNVWLVTTQPI